MCQREDAQCIMSQSVGHQLPTSPVCFSGLPWWLRQYKKKSACHAGDLGSIPGLEDPLEKEMVTHFSIRAWRIPWTEEPGELLSIESHRLFLKAHISGLQSQ